MTTQPNYETTKAKLTRHNQQHLLRFWDELDDAGRQQLLADIEQIDLPQVARLIETHVLREPVVDVPGDIQPPPILPNAPADDAQNKQYGQARLQGGRLISSGRLACLTVAGGQGTRLGLDGPKGALPISPIRNKPLFQLFAEMIRNGRQRFRSAIPWLIMTSPVNDSATRQFFEQNDYFGLGKSGSHDVHFFTQGVMPAIGLDGRILLAERDRLALSPDGHGGTLRALHTSGMLDMLSRRGVSVLSYFQVDNPLVHPVDPLFIGLHDQARAQISSKTIPKAGPTEKVGNFCIANGRLMVVEYSDLPDELAHKTGPDGRRLFDAGSIAIHLFDVPFVAGLNRVGGFALPVHRAVKKVPHVDDSGRPVVPAAPNGIKLETFVFDALPLAERTIIWQTRRDEEFAPAKNATGTDSVATARAAMVARAGRWLQQAGVAVPCGPDGVVAATIEISPLLAESAEQLAESIEPSDIRLEPGDLLYLE